MWKKVSPPTIVVQTPQVERFPWASWAQMSESDEVPEWSEKDVEWLAQLAQSWQPVTEAEPTFLEVWDQSTREQQSAEELKRRFQYWLGFVQETEEEE